MAHNRLPDTENGQVYLLTGKCDWCSLRYLWRGGPGGDGPITRKEAYCPECGDWLHQTTRQSQLPLGKSRPLTRVELEALPYSAVRSKRLDMVVKKVNGDLKSYNDARERRRAEVARQYDR